MARPSKKRDEDLAAQIRTLAQYGVSQEDIARSTGMALETLRKYYLADIHKGQALANAQVGRKLFERCMAGDIAALIFWAKCRMGWREKDRAAPEGAKEEAQAGVLLTPGLLGEAEWESAAGRANGAGDK